MDPDFDLDAYIALMAESLGIPVAPDERPDIAVQMRRTADLAAQVMEFEAPPELEPAPVFKP